MHPEANFLSDSKLAFFGKKLAKIAVGVDQAIFELLIKTLFYTK